MNLDRGWRLEAAKEAMISKKAFDVLDSATGTGDLAFAVYDEALVRGKRVRITGTDFVKEMLDLAVEKAAGTGRGPIRFLLRDSLRRGFASGSFDVITTGFALRNFDSVKSFLHEAYRLLKPHGRLVVLEMAMPDRPAQRLQFSIYSCFVRFVSIFAGSEYGWLVDSIKRFDKSALVKDTRGVGFKRIRLRSLRSGVAYLLIAEK